MRFCLGHGGGNISASPSLPVDPSGLRLSARYRPPASVPPLHPPPAEPSLDRLLRAAREILHFVDAARHQPTQVDPDGPGWRRLKEAVAAFDGADPADYGA